MRSILSCVASFQERVESTVVQTLYRVLKMVLNSYRVSELNQHRWPSSISVRGQDRCSSDAPEESGSWPRTVQWNQIEVNEDDQQSTTCEDHQ